MPRHRVSTSMSVDGFDYYAALDEYEAAVAEQRRA